MVNGVARYENNMAVISRQLVVGADVWAPNVHATVILLHENDRVTSVPGAERMSDQGELGPFAVPSPVDDVYSPEAFTAQDFADLQASLENVPVTRRGRLLPTQQI